MSDEKPQNAVNGAFSAAAAPDLYQGLSVISCAEDPLNLCMPADGIVRAIHERSRKLQPRQPLVVLIGVNHSCPAHVLLPNMVASRLKSIRKSSDPLIGTGFEQSYDYGRKVDLKGSIKKEGLFLPLGDDTHGSNSLMSLRWLGIDEAPFAHDIVFDWLYRNAGQSISFRFHDLPMKRIWNGSEKITYLDQQDSTVRELIRKYLPQGRKASELVQAAEPFGVYLRNLFAAEGIMRHIKKLETQIYVYYCGAAHVLGVQYDGTRWPYAKSLTALLQARGASVLPVVPFSSEFPVQNLAADLTDGAKAKTIFIAGMSGKQFDRENPVEAEIEFVQSLARHSNGEIYISPNMISSFLRKKDHAKTSLLNNDYSRS